MSKEAMKLALEALEAGEYYIDDLEAIVYAADDLGTHEDKAKMQAAITVLRLEIDALNMASKPALAEQPAQQEPEYAWPTVADYENDVGLEVNQAFKMGWDMARTTNSFLNQLAGVTPQPAQRTWVGLSDEEITDIWAEASPYYHEDDFARAIEAKLKEKNT